MAPTEKQIADAHDAWEQVTRDWRLRRVSNYGLSGDMWLVESVGSPRYEARRDYANEIAYHKFDGPNAETQAKFFLRDKCIRAVLSAALPKSSD